ncbi:MAG: uroporphyrinogen-III synthase [Candidatus Schekmanbacteria bacterium]|nr:MAG: uroporphyrinogen-III synthase [Candidatus Schekmanbacteria bacterium]
MRLTNQTFTLKMAMSSFTSKEKFHINHRLTEKENLPLYFKRIIVTSPRNYASSLIAILTEKGAKAIWLPSIEISPLEDYTILDKAIKNISSYDWIAFTSRNGIEAFFNRLETLKLSIDEVFCKIKTCAIGADSRGLEERGIKATLIPKESSPRGIIEELSKMGVKKEKFLLPVPEVVGLSEPYVVPDFINGLKEIGMITEKVPAYKTSSITSGNELEKQMILEKNVDMIAITSSTEIESLLSIMGEKRDTLNDIPFAIMGPYTGKTAKDRGLNVKVMPEKNFSSFYDFVSAIEDYFKSI